MYCSYQLLLINPKSGLNNTTAVLKLVNIMTFPLTAFSCKPSFVMKQELYCTWFNVIQTCTIKDQAWTGLYFMAFERCRNMLFAKKEEVALSSVYIVQSGQNFTCKLKVPPWTHLHNISASYSLRQQLNHFLIDMTIFTVWSPSHVLEHNMNLVGVRQCNIEDEQARAL